MPYLFLEWMNEWMNDRLLTYFWSIFLFLNSSDLQFLLILLDCNYTSIELFSHKLNGHGNSEKIYVLSFLLLKLHFQSAESDCTNDQEPIYTHISEYMSSYWQLIDYYHGIFWKSYLLAAIWTQLHFLYVIISKSHKWKISIAIFSWVSSFLNIVEEISSRF